MRATSQPSTSQPSGTPKPIRSPSYPGMSVSEAIDAISKIEKQYRSAAVDRTNAARLIGYSSLSGPAMKALADLASYGLLERAGKGEARVTELARDILHPSSDSDKKAKLRLAALGPALFQELLDRFPGHSVPPEDGVVTYLNRQGFNPNSVRHAAKAFLQTMSYLEQIGASDSRGSAQSGEAESKTPDSETGRSKSPITYGGARVGDLIQWESNGVLRLERPMRVRLVNFDGQYVAVDGSETGIPMSEVIVEERAPENKPQPPMFPLGFGELPALGETEWMRNRLSTNTAVRLMVTGEMGPKEIGKLIKLLKAQQAVLSDDDDEDEEAAN